MYEIKINHFFFSPPNLHFEGLNDDYVYDSKYDKKIFDKLN